MSSKFGPRPEGSDGLDFVHREKVAWHYKASSQNKVRLKTTLAIHCVLFGMMLLRMSAAFFRAIHLRPPYFLRQLRLPRAHSWEIIWLLSISAVVFGLLSLRRNHSLMLKQCFIGILVFAVCPLLYGAYDLVDELQQYLENKDLVSIKYFGFPAIVWWYIFIGIAIQVHAFSCFFAFSLLQAWQPIPKPKFSFESLNDTKND